MPRIDTLWWDIEARWGKLDDGVTQAQKKLSGLATFIKQHPGAAFAGLAATIAVVGYQLTKMGVEFDTAMRKVAAAMPGGIQDLEFFKKSVLSLSKEMPFSMEQLAAGLRQVIQVGGEEMRTPAVALDRLRTAARAAAASGTDLGGVIAALDDTMDAFGLEGGQAADQLTRLMFAASQGRAPMDEFMGLMTRLGPFAREAGVGIRDLAALIAASFESGMPPQLAMRALRQAIAGVDEEGRKVPKTAQDLGVAISMVNGHLEVGGRLGEEYRRALADLSGEMLQLNESLNTVTTGPGAEFHGLMRTLRGLALTLGDELAKMLPLQLFEITDEDRRILGMLTLGGAQRGAFAAGPQSPPSSEVPATGDRMGPPKPPPPGRHRATPEQIAAANARARERAGLLDDLRDRVAQTMGDAYSITMRQLDAIEAQFREKFGRNIPDEVAKGLARLRAVAGGDLALAPYDQAMAGLVEKARGLTDNVHATTEEYLAQLKALDEMRSSLENGLEDTTLSADAHDRIRAMLQQIADLERQVLASKKENAGVGKVLLDQDTERLDKLQAQARNIEAAARGALQLARAFGLVDEKTAAMLENVAQLAANIPSLLGALAKGGTAGIIGAALPVAGALAGLVQGLFGGREESPEEKARKEALERNTQAIQELALRIGDFGLDITGRQLAGVQAGVTGFIGGVTQPGRVDPRSGRPLSELMSLRGALAAAGVTMADLRTVAEELRITFAGTVPTVVELQQLLDAINATELARFTETFAGQMTALRAEFELFDITDPIRQLEKLRTTMSAFSPAIAEALAGLDLTRAEDRAIAETRLQAILGQMQAGTLTATQLGNMTAQQLLDAILQLEGTIDQVNQAGATAGVTQQWGVNRTITEATASRQLSLMTTMAYWLEAIAGDTRVLAGSQPPAVVVPGVVEVEGQLSILTTIAEYARIVAESTGLIPPPATAVVETVIPAPPAAEVVDLAAALRAIKERVQGDVLTEVERRLADIISVLLPATTTLEETEAARQRLAVLGVSLGDLTAAAEDAGLSVDALNEKLLGLDGGFTALVDSLSPVLGTMAEQAAHLAAIDIGEPVERAAAHLAALRQAVGALALDLSGTEFDFDALREGLGALGPLAEKLLGILRRSASVAPVIAPTVTPVLAPVVAPVTTPVIAPVVTPMVSPVVTPVVAPVVTPVLAPVVAPVVTPVVAPVVTPVVAPVITPVVAPVVAPVVTPVIEAGGQSTTGMTDRLESIAGEGSRHSSLLMTVANWLERIAGNTARIMEAAAVAATAALRTSGEPPEIERALREALQRFGLTLTDLTVVAQQLDAGFTGAIPTVAELTRLVTALAETDLAIFREQLEAQAEAWRLEAQKFSFAGPVEQLGLLRDRATALSPVLAELFADLDVGTVAGWAELLKRIQAGAVAAGHGEPAVPPREEEVPLGTGPVRAAELPDSLRILQTTASRQLWVLTILAYWAEQVAHNAEALGGAPAPVVTPVLAPVVAPVLAPVIAPVVAPVITPVVAPVLAPVVESPSARLMTTMSRWLETIAGNTGATIEAITTAAAAALRANNEPMEVERALREALQELGLTMTEVGVVAQELGAGFAGAIPTATELTRLLTILAETDLGAFREQLEAQSQAWRVDAQAFTLAGPAEQLALLRDRVADLSPVLQGLFVDLDVGTVAGWAELLGRIRGAARLANNAEPTARATEEPALLATGDLARVAERPDGLRALQAAVGQQLSSLAGMAYWLQAIAANTDAMVGRLAPPDAGTLAAFRAAVGGGGLTVGQVSITVQVSLPPGATTAQAVDAGRAVGAGAAEEVNRQLYQLALRRARALGQATLQ